MPYPMRRLRSLRICAAFLYTIASWGPAAIVSADEPSDEISFSRAHANRPNVVIILLDDVGFGASGTFGGVVPTPSLDRLAESGLRYNNFHTTSICAATRAALLAGRNHHRVGFGLLPEFHRDLPGYNAVWNPHTASIALVLKDAGYETAAIGKWHNFSPDFGDRRYWPGGLGFEYSYIGMGSEFSPSVLLEDGNPAKPSRTPEEGYHLTTDITDHAVDWLNRHYSSKAQRPYFLYFAPQATHSPHQAPRAWIDRFRGRFDNGWDSVRKRIFERQIKEGIIPPTTRLTKRPAELNAWKTLSVNERRLFSRQMEVYAGFLAQTDYEVGRLIDSIEDRPDSENTLIFYIVGDNGASGEGGPLGTSDDHHRLRRIYDSVQDQLKTLDKLGGAEIPFNNYSAGWAWAMNTPFKLFKQNAGHFGGTQNGMVVEWGSKLKQHQVTRNQFTYITDVAATVYEATDVHLPTQVNGIVQDPLDGVSFLYTFDSSAAPSRHTVQYFEIMGNRGIYKEGWMASAVHSLPWIWDRSDDFSLDRWELYYVPDDFSQARDVASKYPEKLRALKELFDDEAKRNNVYPMSAGPSLEQRGLQ